MKRHRLLTFLVLVLALACDDSRHPTGGIKNVPVDPHEIIQDGTDADGNPDFFFLPPMVPPPFWHPNFELGKFNNALQPSLYIEICELRSENLHPTLGTPTGLTGCVGADRDIPGSGGTPLKTFAPGTVKLVNLPLREFGWWSLFRLPADGFYYVLWNTRQSNLSTSKYYRIKILIQGDPHPLGIADVDPMSSLGQWKHSKTGEVVQMIDDFLLPIPFRVEQGALCEGTDGCASATFSTEATTPQTLTFEADPDIGAVAAVEVPPGAFRADAPDHVVFTIEPVPTGGSGLFSPASAQQPGPTLCHPALNLQQFRGCFKITTTPELAIVDGAMFAEPITVAACFELHDSGDPREEWVQLWSSDVDESPRPLESTDAAHLLGPNGHNCGESEQIGSNSNGVMQLASTGLRKLQRGLGRAFGVKTAYAVDKGLGGLTKLLSNIGPAMSAEIQRATEAEIALGPGGQTRVTIRIVGTRTHDGRTLTEGIPDIPVTFTISGGGNLDIPNCECEGGTQQTVNTDTYNANQEGPTGGYASIDWTVPTTAGPHILTVTNAATGEPMIFTANVSAVPNPILLFESAAAEGSSVIYELTVTNYAAYPAEMFVASPSLPPCGLNESASRTWVDIFDASNDARIYGFCAFGSPSDLQSIWFSFPAGTAPPSVYIRLIDRLANVTYTSNTVVPTAPPAAAPDLFISSGAPIVIPATVSSVGGAVVFSPWTIMNQGGAFLLGGNTVENGFYLSTDPVITTSDTYLNDNNFNSTEIQGAGAFFNWGAPTFTIPPRAPGIYYVGILVDRANVVAESDETNNYKSVAITVVGPDQTAIPWAPTERRMLSMQTGASYQINVTQPNVVMSWFSSNTTNVTVNAGGLVTALVGGENISAPADASISSVLSTESPGPNALVNSFSFNLFPRITTLAWNAVEGAVSYEVVTQFGNGSDPEPPFCSVPATCTTWTGGSTFTTGLTHTYEFVGAQPGRWRVFARNAAGTVIHTSAYVYFDYDV